MIYLIQADEDGPVKIGCAKDVLARFHDLQVANPVRLTLLGVVDGEEAEERRIHARFSQHRLRGEWFSPAQEIIDFAAPLPVPERPSRKCKGTSALEAWVIRNRMTRSDFAKRAGISPASFTLICQGKQWVGPGVARAIERETRGEVTANDLLAAYQGDREAAA